MGLRPGVLDRHERGSQPRTPMMNEQGPVFSDYNQFFYSPFSFSSTHVHMHLARALQNFCWGRAQVYSLSNRYQKITLLLIHCTLCGHSVGLAHLDSRQEQKGAGPSVLTSPDSFLKGASSNASTSRSSAIIKT